MKDLKSEKLTYIWKKRMEDGLSILTVENIQETEFVLDKFIDDLIQLQGDKSREKILEIVEEAVLKLNDLDEKYDHFIETDEREELWEFIDKAARRAGLEIEEGEDITEDFRDW